MRGYELVVPEDCVAARGRGKYGAVLSTEMRPGGSRPFPGPSTALDLGALVRRAGRKRGSGWTARSARRR